MLNFFGISTDAESVYRLMLTQPSWGVAELAAHLGMAQGQVRHALDELSDLALLRPSWNDPHRLLPVSPALGLSVLLEQAQDQVSRQQRQIEVTRAAIDVIASEYDGSLSRESALRFEGIDSVRLRIEELSAAAQREVVSLNPVGAQAPDAKEASKPLNQRLLERGVGIRCVYQDSFRNDPALLAYSRWLTRAGGQLRTVPVLPILLVVYDGQVALVPIDPANGRVGAVELRGPGVVAALQGMFELLWSSGTALEESSTTDDVGLTAADRELLRLLTQGHTDESAARKLGLSLRTVRRTMSRLMERLDARSRFQAGVHAARRGWL